MKKIFLCLFVILSFVGVTSYADDVEYSIDNYDGVLKIHQDNTADFYQTITYNFDSDYNGQIVTLGEAGHMPTGFKVDSQPKVSVETDYEYCTVTSDIKKINNGYQLKIYNSGVVGDTVVVKVHWKLRNLFFAYQDVAELNWVPISDWNVVLNNVSFKVLTDKTVSDSQLWAHRGYLKSANVRKISNGYQISAKNISGKLEIHGYWNKSIISESKVIPKKRKSAILNQENRINKVNIFLVALLHHFSIVFSGILATIAIIMFVIVMVVINKNNYSNHFSKTYEIPDDLPPLVVLKYVYDLDVFQLFPKYRFIPKRFSFSRTVQATLVDLINRQAIVVKGERLIRNRGIVLRAYERDVIDMAFGNKNEVDIHSLFSSYRFDKKVVKKYKKRYKGDERKRKLNSLAENYNRRFKSKLNSISIKVNRDIKNRKLPNIRTEIPQNLKICLNIALYILFISLALLVICTFYLFVKEDDYASIYCLAMVIDGLITYFVYKVISKIQNGTIVTAKGKDYIQEWNSFRNMIRSAGKFNKVKLENVTSWDNFLVYATLFGYAHRIQKYLKNSDIKFVNKQLTMVNEDTWNMIGMQARYCESINYTTNSATSFSASSSGSESGGFSGGGGGGGGGAF